MKLPKGTKRLLSYLLFVIGLQWKGICALSEDLCEGKHMVKCKNKGCVPASFKCDGEDDCGDNSDESDCQTSSAKPQCVSEDFVCANEKCIVRSYVCDGEDDCGDNSDERNCTSTERHISSCESPSNFQCKNGACIPQIYTCDGVDDCSDNSDESKTDGPKCPEKQECPDSSMFRCKKSGFCISKLQLCDGNNDCSLGVDGGDTSDEQNCTAHPCLSGQHKCDNGICISAIWRCNSIDDCGDGSDERGCDALCGKSEFECKATKVCISSTLRCDGKKNCADGSDEYHCPHKVPTKAPSQRRPCTDRQYKCPSNNKCIMNSWLCDGNNDCPNNEDESLALCTARTCAHDQLQCHNGQCVPKKYKCDGVTDCHDKSDEKDCNIVREMTCSKDTYKCKNSTKCIHPVHFCDGTKNCPQGEDEGPKCGINECSVDKGNCSHGCKDIALGHICTCPVGYKLSPVDNRTCTDVNECKEFGRCTQSCVNYEGSYSCLCDKGFTLDITDKKTCRAGAPKPYLLFANSFDIREVSLSGDDYKPIISIWSSIVALAVDTRDAMVYWADNYNQTISRAPMGNPSQVKVIMNNITLPKGLDVDWIGRKLYWTDSSSKSISVSNLDGSGRKVLIRGGPREEFRGIAVHPERGYIFWTNWVGSHSKIERANLDGSNRRTIVASGIVWVSGLAIDYQLDRVYWSDRYHRHISSSTIHGTDVRKIVTNLYEPTGLTIFEDKVYWIDSDQKKLSRANKFDGYKRTEYKENFVSPMDLVINHPLAQKKDGVSHPCDVNNGGCTHLCFYTNVPKRTVTCSCPDGLVLNADMRTCYVTNSRTADGNEVPTNLVPVVMKCMSMDCQGDDNDSTTLSVAYSGGGSGSRRTFMIAYIVGGVLAVLCISTIVIVVVLYRKKRNQFGLSILYETDVDFVCSNQEKEEEEGEDEEKVRCESKARKYLPDFKTRCKKAVVSFDNINFKSFKNDSDVDIIATNHEPDVDLVMDDCPIDDDRQPIIAHIV